MQLDDIKAATSTDALADLLDTYCWQEGLPYASADDLLLRTLHWRELLQAFCDRWEAVQREEDFLSAIAARGE